MSSRVATRYSKSLLELAVEQNVDDRVYEEMNDIYNTVSNSSDLASLLRNPVISSSDKIKVWSAIFPNHSSATKRFVELVTDRKREKDLTDMALSYIQRYNDLKGVARATVRSAFELSEDVMSRIQKYLQGALQKDTIQLENIIDKSVIGGMIIRYEDRLLDLSVSKELKEIRKHLIYN